jgi:hypothetical protein
MAQWTDYWRIITPKSNKQQYEVVDSYTGNAYGNYTWYANILKGSGQRLQKYNQIDAMDNDVLISRALDTIAEEMTPTNSKTRLPLEIRYNNEDNSEVSEITVATLRAALRHWCRIHNLEAVNFHIARYLVKYGDCFFRKTSDFKKWSFLNPKDIIGIEIDGDENIVSYHLKKGENKQGYNQHVEILPADGVVHFSLSDIIDSNGPFGDSILTPIMKSFKQLQMLEDAVIIYRIVRAPERRVFFIDTGNMPPQKQKQYLENIKNDIRQKRIPTQDGGQQNMDSAYNPMGMLEDYFFATSSSGKGSRVETLPGGENLGEITDLNYFQGKVLMGLRVPNSYMRGADQGGGTENDGKVGIAYIEELRFANFVIRLQQKISNELDIQFKKYLKAAGIKIDPNLFELDMVEPQNFALYKQAAIDAELIGTFQQVDGIDYISKRFALKRYFGWTEEDVQMNESMIKQERAIPDGGVDNEVLPELRMIYDPKWKENRPEIKVPETLDNVASLDGEEAPIDGEEAPMDGEEAPEGDTGTEAPAGDTGDENAGPEAEELPDLTDDSEALNTDEKAS